MDLLLVREPIFDAEGDVFGYELRHSVGLQAEDPDDESAAEAALIHDLTSSHLKQVTHGRPAFVRVTASMLGGGLVQLLPRNRVVVQLSCALSGRPDLLISCRQLFREGFRFAIDDFTPSDKAVRLLEVSRYVRMNVTDGERNGLSPGIALAGRLKRPAIATGIDTVDTLGECRELGFRYFQGQFFKSAERVSMQGAPAQAIHIMRLLRLARDPRNSNRELEDAIRVDPTLTFRLLKLVNSAAIGGRGIESIAHAIQLLGRIPLQRWLTVLLVAATRRSGGYDTELAMTALVRGRYLEIMAQGSDGALDEGTMFLVGLFSVVDALMQLSMEEVVETAGLPRIVEDALLRREGLAGTALGMLEAYDAGDWPTVSELRKSLPVAELDLADTYGEAVRWARSQLEL